MQAFLLSNPRALSSDNLGKLTSCLKADMVYLTLKAMEQGVTQSDAIQSFYAIKETLKRSDQEGSRIQFVQHKPPYDTAINAKNLYVAGGCATDYLDYMNYCQNTDGYTLAEMIRLRKYNPNYFYFGTSASGMVAGLNVKADAWRRGNEAFNTAHTKGLGFIKDQVVPHYGSELYPTEMIDALLEKFAQLPEISDADRRFILLPEDSGLHINFDKRTASVLGTATLRDIALGTEEPLSDAMLMDEVNW